MTEISHQFISNIIRPRSRTTFNASPGRIKRVSFIRIRYGAGTPTYAYVDSLQFDYEERIWPYPEKRFPIELFADKGNLNLNPELRLLFPSPRILLGSQVTIGIRNDAPEPLSVSVTFEWEEGQS